MTSIRESRDDVDLQAHHASVLPLVLAENLNDYMSLAMFTHYTASFSGFSGMSLRSIVIGQICAALDAGLLRVGDVVGADYYPWPLSPSDCIARINSAWPERLPEPAFECLQDICWLVNTPAGDRVATALSERRHAQQA